MNNLPRLFICKRLRDEYATLAGILVPTLPCAGCTEDIIVPLQLVKVCERQPYIKRRLVCGQCADRAAFNMLDKMKTEDPERWKIVAAEIEKNGGKLP